MVFDDTEEYHIRKVTRDEMLKIITSPVYLVLSICILSLAGFIILNSYATLEKVSDAVNELQTSVRLLNNSLVVIDDRTQLSEELVHEIYKDKLSK